MVKEDVYVRNKEAVLVNSSNRFIYEVNVFCRYEKYFGLIDNKLYTCNQEIPGIISHFFKNAHTEIVCSLFSAPISWLLDNGFVKYVKPDKTTKIKTTKSAKHGKSKTTIGKSRSWTAPGEANSSRVKEYVTL